MSLRLKDRVALITGGGRGIGRSIALAYSKEGAKVAIFSRTLSDLRSTVSGIESAGGVGLPLVGNVAISADVESAVKKTLERFGTIDILVNNAGIGGPESPLEQVAEEEWDQVMDTNVKGMFLFMKYALPYMLSKGRGNIINMTSGAGKKKPSKKVIRSVPYAVSKFAIEGLTYTMSIRLAGTGINVNALEPGPIRTSIWPSYWTEEDFVKYEASVSPMHKTDFADELAIYLAALSPGELTGQSIDAIDWNKTYSEK